MPSSLAPYGPVLVFLLAVPAFYLAAAAFGRVLKRRAGVRLGVGYQLLGLVLSVFLAMVLLGWNFGVPPYDLRRALAAASILLAMFFVDALVRRYFWELYFARRQIVIPKFLQQLFAVLAFCLALLAVSYWLYGYLPTNVQLTSTVVVGILGLALQSLLGNVIAGLSLQIGKPFVSGDWLVVDNQHAEVIEINWRSTRLRTHDDYYLDVPNSKIVSSTIVNVSYPSHLHALRMRVGIVYDAAPNEVKSVLGRAILATEGVLDNPVPKVFLVDFADSAVTYEIKYWIDNHAHFNEIADSLYTNVWYALRRAGIAIPFPVRTLHIERKRPDTHPIPEGARDLVRRKPFFSCLSDEQASRIIDSGRLTLFGIGEKIVEQGADGSSMFILLTGRADVYVHRPENGAEPAKVGALQAGDYFGEMSLLTGETRSATVIAAADCQVLEITKPNIAPMLQENADLMRNLSEMLARRRMENEGALASVGSKHTIVEKEKEYAARFLARLASFFEL